MSLRIIFIMPSLLITFFILFLFFAFVILAVLKIVSWIVTAVTVVLLVAVAAVVLKRIMSKHRPRGDKASHESSSLTLS